MTRLHQSIKIVQMTLDFILSEFLVACPTYSDFETRNIVYASIAHTILTSLVLTWKCSR